MAKRKRPPAGHGSQAPSKHQNAVLPLRPGLLNEVELSKLRSAWSAADVPHVVLEAAFDAAGLSAVRDELVSELKGMLPIQNSHTSVRVTPLLPSSDPCTLPSALVQLMNKLQSLDFLKLVQGIASCGLLLPEPRAALIAVPPGGRWLPQCVGGNRMSQITVVGNAETPEDAVAFALFLTEDWWSSSDGGHVELFGQSDSKPLVSVEPRLGTLLLHAAGHCISTTPVVTDQAPQLAIHGVFRANPLMKSVKVQHADPPGLAKTLRTSSSRSSGFGEAQCRVLEGLVVAKHLDLQRLTALRKDFADASQLRLRGFLLDDVVKRVGSALQAAVPSGPGRGWHLQGPVRKIRCLSFDCQPKRAAKKKKKRSKAKSRCPAGEALAEVAAVMASDAFMGFVEALTGVVPAAEGCVQVRCFRPGLDYERPSCTKRSQLDIVLCLSADTPKLGTVKQRRKERRLLSERGGGEGYMEDALEQTPAEEAGLLAGPNGLPLPQPVLLELPLAHNTLQVVLRDSKTAHYVEPLASCSPNSRWEVRMTIPVEDVPEEGEEEEGKEESEVESAFELDDDAKEEHATWYRTHRLMSPKEAQGTQVVRVEEFLSSSEISDFINAVRLLQGQRLCWQTLHQTEGPRKGWRTTYLHTNGVFQTRFGSLSAKLMQTILDVDAANWNLLEGRKLDDLNFRTVEFHEYTPGGRLQVDGHYDSGSLVTIDVMLADSSRDFEGGQLSLPEADGSTTTPQMNKGDAVLFVSHKYHNVTPVTAGKRTVLVLELWEGPPRTCAHRCTSTDPCGYTLDHALSLADGGAIWWPSFDG